jgi:hypothetical protein
MSALHDSGLEPDDPIISPIRPGTIIAYRLLPVDMPLNPNKVWRGKVKWCNDTIILVDMLEPGYNGLNEMVTYEQLVGVEYTQ